MENHMYVLSSVNVTAYVDKNHNKNGPRVDSLSILYGSGSVPGQA